MRGFREVWTALFFGTGFLVSSPVQGQDSLPAYLTPETSGPDFSVQGEYLGLIGDVYPLGAQIISRGSGIFEGILFGGGLPGAGWDERTRFHLRGHRTSDAVMLEGVHGERLMFTNPNIKGTIEENIFQGQSLCFQNRVSDPLFSLHKVTRQSPTLGSAPPEGACVLFDGTDTDAWVDGQIVENKLLRGGTRTKQHFGDHMFHLEYRTPYMPTAKGMQRGNSGVYVQNIWEIQIVDSFGWNEENRKYERLSIFGQAGGLHEMIGPRINMSFPPLSWQTFDVEFVSARFDDKGNKMKSAMITVYHNGILIHDRYVIPSFAPGRDPVDERDKGPLYLQDHKNPVVYRNIWLVER